MSAPGPVVDPPMGTAQRVLAVLWALALLPASAVLAAVAVFGLSPTQCPPTGGSYLCRYPWATTVTLGVVAALALLALVLALVGAAARTGPRGARLSGISVAVFVTAVVVTSTAASTWT